MRFLKDTKKFITFEYNDVIPPHRSPLPPLKKQSKVKDSGKHIEYTVSATIFDNMVVQRNSYFNVFGWSENISGVIYGEFMGEQRYAVIDEEGSWCIQFSSHEATTETQILKIYPKNGESVEFKNILVGDIWIVSGQSNSELTVNNTISNNPKYKQEINPSDLIRIFPQYQIDAIAAKETSDITKPQKDVVRAERKWQETTVDNVYAFSALGYYFAKELTKNVSDVPIGVIMAAAGGAVLHELMPDNIAKKVGLTQGNAVPSSGYYNTLIHPFTNNEITGMIFYQGESDCINNRYETYATNLCETVNEYRKIWKTNFVFINVQLSTHTPTSLTEWPQLPEIRVAQFNAYKMIKDSYIVTAMDQALKKHDPDWAHPGYKLELGKRAATIAASVVYNKLDSNYAFCPEPDTVKLEDTKVTIKFKYTGDGLKLLSGEVVSGFLLFDEEGQVNCTAKIINSNTIEVSTENVVMGSVVGFGYGLDHDGSVQKANVANSLDYPLPAFKIIK